MSEKVSVAIEVMYQATSAATGLSDVQMDVYDEGHVIDAPKGGVMTEIGSTGRYYKAFTPDVVGEWTVLINSVTTPGKIVKKYSVVASDIATVVTDVAALNDVAVGDFNNISIANIATELATYDAPTKAELDSGLSAIQGGSETLETVKTAVDALGTPPMVG